MSSDGASIGLDADSALKAVFGEEPDHRSTTQELADRVRAATNTGEFDYSSCADYAAKLILDWLVADPARAQGPVEPVYRYGPEGEWTGEMIEKGWYELMEENDPERYRELEGLGLSGFMWGWAVNAARTILELPEVPNPAIITVNI